MRIAVVGATGNVGTALLRRLAHEPRVGSVIGIARRAPDQTRPPYRDVQWRQVDISMDASGEELRSAFDGVDAVVHLAWLLQPSHDDAVMLATNVYGTRRVVDACRDAGVDHLVVSSSVGAYSPVPHDGADIPRDESWPTRGNARSAYSRQKGVVEGYLDEVERSGDMVVSRVRPGLVFQRDAGSEIGRYFLGRLAPLVGLLRHLPVPVLPLPPSLRFQAVHADDLAEAFWLVLERRAGGAFNVAADPVLGAPDLAASVGARVLPVPFSVLRMGAGLTWLAHLQPTSAGWVNLGAGAPVMDTSRARDVLGWRARHSSQQALAELVAGMVHGRGGVSPPLQPRSAA